MAKLTRFFFLARTFGNQASSAWKTLPALIRWPLAVVRQLPVTLAVAKLPIPYNFAVPVLCAAGKTVVYRITGASNRSLVKYYFKTLSRTLFGFSLRRFIEQTAKYTLSSHLGISDEALQAVGFFMIIVCVLLDAMD
jgi:hypothetical protein